MLRIFTLLVVLFSPAALSAPHVIVTLPPGNAGATLLAEATKRWRESGIVRDVLRLDAVAQEEPGFSVLLVIEMADEAAATRWENDERVRLPAGALAKRADACVHGEGGVKNLDKALFEVNVYRMKVPSTRYDEFCRDYIAPLMAGQAEAGLMLSYTMYLERGPAGESNAVLVKAYRDANTYHREAADFKLKLRERLTKEHPAYPKLHAIKDTLRDNVSETLAVKN